MDTINCWTVVFMSAFLVAIAEDLQCPPSCTCADSSSGVTVKCSNITTFPQFSGDTSNVTALDLRNNDLASITQDDLKQVSNVRRLLLSENKITTLVNGTFEASPNVEMVDLTNNSLSEIETGVFQHLGSLETIDLKLNKISRLRSKVFKNLTKLTHLYLSDNNIGTIEENALSGVHELQLLWLTNNNLSSVPSHIFKFTPNLRFLHLEGNQITELKNFAFSPLANLSSISLSNNKFNVIEDRVFQLENRSEIRIHRLYMENCGLVEFPKVLNDLYYATDMDLSSNNFTKIPAAVFLNLENLSFLRIFRVNELRKVHRDAFLGLDNLRYFHLSHCPNLEELPDELLWHSTKLSGLYINGNNLKTIPEHLAKWDSLDTIDLQGNDLVCDCNAAWIQNKKRWPSEQISNNVHVLDCKDEKGNLEKVRNFDFGSLQCSIPPHVSRVLTGAIAAIISVAIVIVLCVACKYRRKIVFKYRHFKYSRHVDDSPYTINAQYSDLDARQPNDVNVYRDKDDENLI